MKFNLKRPKPSPEAIIVSIADFQLTSVNPGYYVTGWITVPTQHGLLSTRTTCYCCGMKNVPSASVTFFGSNTATGMWYDRKHSAQTFQSTTPGIAPSNAFPAHTYPTPPNKNNAALCRTARRQATRTVPGGLNMFALMRDGCQS